MAISDDTLSSDVFTTIRAVIVASAPKITYTDKASASKTKTASVYAQYNDKTPTSPQIIIIPADVSEDSWRFGGTEGKKLINVGIECYYKTTLGIDQLADTIEAAIKTAVENSTITGMDLVGVSENYAFVDPSQMKFHLKTLTFTFDRE